MVREKLPIVEKAGRSELRREKNCQLFFDFICQTDTFLTKDCGETFKIQSEPFNVTLRR